MPALLNAEHAETIGKEVVQFVIEDLGYSIEELLPGLALATVTLAGGLPSRALVQQALDEFVRLLEEV